MVALSQLVHYDTLLQNVTAFLLQNATVLSQNLTIITKCDDFITKSDSYYILKCDFCKY